MNRIKLNESIMFDNSKNIVNETAVISLIAYPSAVNSKVIISFGMILVLL